MVFSAEDFSRTLELVRRRIPYEIHMKPITPSKSKNQIQEVLLRSEVKDWNEVTKFIEAYESVTQSNFNFISNKNTPNSPVSSRKWICNHGVVSGLNKKCSASISILIKTVTNESMLHDDFLRKYPPLPAVIKINPNHNHRLTIPLPAYKLLKINNDVKICFYEYFKRGYFGRRAKWLHEQYLQKANFSRADESMNPNLRAVYTLANNWIKCKDYTEVDKVIGDKNSESLPVENIKKENEEDQSSSQNFEFINIDDVVANLKIEPDDEYTVVENIANETVDTQPVLTIKQEIIEEDETAGLPVISSCSSLVVPSPPTFPVPSVIKSSTAKRKAKAATESVTSLQCHRVVHSPPSKVIIYNKSSNTCKIVKCLSVNANTYSASQYKSYLPNALVPMRISLQRL